ncbi:MAG TPA: membrane protein insertion efficiency factor YidD [Vicinamibacterales bacterium]|nr:membrane protein insertion efficiency factor YidD [Vicinamibacterales bacterium]
MTSLPSAHVRRRRKVLLLPLLAVLALAIDVSRAPQNQLSARAALTGIRWYQRTASTWMASAGVACRFEPTCSDYAAAVIERDGTVIGGAKTVVRLLRCGPWTPIGTVDEP